MKGNQKTKQRKNESGNVLFYILIAVVLFAALNFVVGNMMRGGDTEVIGEEQAKLYAADILDYARSVKQAVQAMRISNGCTETDIRFVDALTTGYGTSVRANCDVFDSTGGDMNYIAPIDKYGTGTEWLFVGSNTVAGVGTTAPDLVIILQNINQSICEQINEKLGIASVASDADGVDYSKFTGTYASTEQIDIADNKPSGCLNDTTTGGGNFFFQALVVR